jgi:hypothetical protein
MVEPDVVVTDPPRIGTRMSVLLKTKYTFVHLERDRRHNRRIDRGSEWVEIDELCPSTPPSRVLRDMLPRQVSIWHGARHGTPPCERPL